MFSDPQSITVNAVAKSLAAVSRMENASVYKMDTGDYSLTITKARTRDRKRFTVRIDAFKIADDPLIVTTKVASQATVMLTINSPLAGFSNVELKDISLALTAWANSANTLRVLADET